MRLRWKLSVHRFEDACSRLKRRGALGRPLEASRVRGFSDERNLDDQFEQFRKTRTLRCASVAAGIFSGRNARVTQPRVFVASPSPRPPLSLNYVSNFQAINRRRIKFLSLHAPRHAAHPSGSRVSRGCRFTAAFRNKYRSRRPPIDQPSISRRAIGLSETITSRYLRRETLVIHGR